VPVRPGGSTARTASIAGTITAPNPKPTNASQAAVHGYPLVKKPTRNPSAITSIPLAIIVR